MIRVYFVFEDPLDDTGVNLSYVDVPTKDPAKAFSRVQEAATSGELWTNLYPARRNTTTHSSQAKCTTSIFRSCPERSLQIPRCRCSRAR